MKSRSLESAQLAVLIAALKEIEQTDSDFAGAERMRNLAREALANLNSEVYRKE